MAHDHTKDELNGDRGYSRDMTDKRVRMVSQQIEARGIRNRRVLSAMKAVPREAFIPEEIHDLAYEDGPLPIGFGQTISQPYIVAMMIDAAGVAPGDKVLDVGTGSGYSSAVASRIADNVISIERNSELAARASEVLARLGYENVTVVVGDGSLGWPREAPFDAILVAAGGPKPPPALLSQLTPSGRLVIPIGTEHGGQQLVRMTERDGTFVREKLGAVAFVPLIGAEGW